jgi:hypothetical protein
MGLYVLWLETFEYHVEITIFLTIMEPFIARCVFYITNKMQLIQCSLLLSALYMFRAVFPPIIRSFRTVFAALGIVMLSCCLPLVWMGPTHPHQR